MIKTFLLVAAFVAGSSLAHAQAPKLKLCTGGNTGKYYEVGQKLHSSLRGKIDVDVQLSTGSDANLRRMENSGAADGCDAAVVQADALTWYRQTYKGNALKFERITTLYPEYVNLICHKESGISKIKDFYGTKDKNIAIGKPGSGTAITWFNFVKAEKRYEPISTTDIDGTIALNRLRSNEISCIMFVAGLGTGTMKRINDENNGELVMVNLNDGDLTNAKDEKGRPIYRWEKIPGGTYPKLQTGLFSTAVETVAQDAILIVNQDWVEKNDRAYTDLSTAAVRLAKQLTTEK